MSPPGWCLRSRTNSTSPPSTTVELAHSWSSGGGRSDVLLDAVDERRERLDLAARPELRPLVVATAAEDDRVLCRDQLGNFGVHRVVPAEETIRGMWLDPAVRQEASRALVARRWTKRQVLRRPVRGLRRGSLREPSGADVSTPLEPRSLVGGDGNDGRGTREAQRAPA